ncbi:MAG: hypothetical protein NC418_11815, partial [Muribaculaceae bacterium]|nr:hypothetical protein [Muribaculaceae bacterium]
MNTTPKSLGLVELTVSDPANILIDTRATSHPTIRRATVPEADLEHWTEAPAPTFNTAAYEARVEELIRA